MKNNSSLFVVITTARACKFEKNERREITTKTSQNENEYKKKAREYRCFFDRTALKKGKDNQGEAPSI